MRIVFLLSCLSMGLNVIAEPHLETVQWQMAIDQAAAQGGGRVVIPAGHHLVGQLYLRSNVELHLAQGAVLDAARGRENYQGIDLPFSEGRWSAIVFGMNVTNVAITGAGMIDGHGAEWSLPPASVKNQEGTRPRGIFFADSSRIRIEDITLRDAACWGIVFKCCEHVRARRVTIDNHANYNNDGFDIEAHDVVVEDCVVDSGDDSYCIKSNNPKFLTGDILIRNCVGKCHSNCFKIGTATHGVIRHVRFENCRATLATRDFISKKTGRKCFYREGYSERYPNGVGKSGLTVQNVDGGSVSDVVVKGMRIDGYLVPFFIRGGTRTGRECGTPPNTLYDFHDITFEDVRGTSVGPNPCWIAGVDGCRVKKVTLRNVEIECIGSGCEKRATQEPDTSLDGAYPYATLFADLFLPVYGLYVTHAEVACENVHFPLKGGTEDFRPAMTTL